MLSLTNNAAHVVHDLTERAGLPDDGGMRIAEAAESGAFELSLVQGPVDGDQLIEQEGARVFVAPAAADLLADQQLDAANVEGGTGFSLGPKAD